MMEMHKSEKSNVLKRLTKHSIEQITSPGSDCENGSDGLGPSSPKKHKDPDKIVSYTEMIAKAIFASPNNMSTLAEIYNYLIVKYPILNSRGKSWKNSVRHTLSLNEWFVKIPKLDNAKCCYWSIHSVYIQRFRRGDFQKQRKASVVKMCSQQNQRYYDYGYDISPSPDYHFMPPAHYQPEISSGISPHGSFSPWPMHRQYDEMQHFFPNTSPYSPFPMYNIPPPPFPSMYTHDPPSEHHQYTGMPPSAIKLENHTNVSDKYMQSEPHNYRGGSQYGDYYSKHENNNQQYHQQQQKSMDVHNICQSNQDNVPHPQTHVNSTLNLLSNAALSAQQAMHLANAVSQNQIDNSSNIDVSSAHQTFESNSKQIQANTNDPSNTHNPSNTQHIPKQADSRSMENSTSTSSVPSDMRNSLLNLRNSALHLISSSSSNNTQAFPQSFSILPQSDNTTVRNQQLNHHNPLMDQSESQESFTKVEIKSEDADNF